MRAALPLIAVTVWALCCRLRVVDRFRWWRMTTLQIVLLELGTKTLVNGAPARQRFTHRRPNRAARRARRHG